MKNGADYNYDNNKVSYYIDNVEIATLEVNLDNFEHFIEMSNSDKYFYYDEMMKEYLEYLQTKEDNEKYDEH